jgi:hypothetical protein
MKKHIIPKTFLSVVLGLCVSTSTFAEKGAIEPLPVEIIGAVDILGEPYKTPFLLSGSGVVPAIATLSGINLALPAGKRFVIQTISVSARALAGASVQGRLRILTANGLANLGQCQTTFTPQGTWSGSVPGNIWMTYSSTTQCEIRMDSTQHSIVFDSMKTGAEEAHFYVTLFGYLETI